jgi:hypothetical protein
VVLVVAPRLVRRAPRALQALLVRVPVVRRALLVQAAQRVRRVPQAQPVRLAQQAQPVLAQTLVDRSRPARSLHVLLGKCRTRASFDRSSSAVQRAVAYRSTLVGPIQSIVEVQRAPSFEVSSLV